MYTFTIDLMVKPLIAFIDNQSDTRLFPEAALGEAEVDGKTFEFFKVPSFAKFFAQAETSRELQVVIIHVKGRNQAYSQYLPALRDHFPGVKIMLLFGVLSTVGVYEALQEGVAGFLSPGASDEDVHRALAAVVRGHGFISPEITPIVTGFFSLYSRPEYSTLTEQEKNILSAIMRGATYKELAIRFNITMNTVRTHIKNIYQKMGIHSYKDLLKW